MNMQDENLNIDDVVNIDKNLQFLATYDLSGGKMVGINSQDEMFEFQQKIINRFNYFKYLIQTGESTFEDIKNSVLAKNGPFDQTLSKKNIEEDALEIMNSKPIVIKKTNAGPFGTNDIVKNFMNMLDTMSKLPVEPLESLENKNYENHKQIKSPKNNKPVRKRNKKRKNK